MLFTHLTQAMTALVDVLAQNQRRLVEAQFDVCRQWVVEGENLQETLEHFAANVRYIAMKLEHFPHDGVVTGSFHQVTPRIREV